eukprot:1547777-Ditylum_brightwellii.AAC.1
MGAKATGVSLSWLGGRHTFIHLNRGQHNKSFAHPNAEVAVEESIKTSPLSAPPICPHKQY